jgi:hypothetical protein
MSGPWIHQNIMETIKNIRSKKNITGGKKLMNLMAFVPLYLTICMIKTLQMLKKLLKV